MRKILFCGMVIFIWDSSAPPVRPGKQRCVFDCKWTRLDIEWERQKDRKTKRQKDIKDKEQRMKNKEQRTKNEE